MRPIELNELPRYTSRVQELIGAASTKRPKNRQEITREFGLDKWGGLLAQWRANPCGVDGVRGLQTTSDAAQAGMIDGQLISMTPAESLESQVDAVERVLLVDPSRHLVEIGCGYGPILFELLRRDRVEYDSILGIEFTEQGVELARCLAKWHEYGNRLCFHQGDFTVARITDAVLPRQSDVLTSFALSYVSDMSQALLNIVRLEPRRVIHFEPVSQDFDDRTLLGMLQRRYVELNDYNAGLKEELARLEREGTIELLAEYPLIWGGNCLSPLSCLVWQPRIGADAHSGV